jgi:Tol biopolymer transport system component
VPTLAAHLRFALVALAVALALPAAARDRRTRAFVTEQQPFVLGQAVDWVDDQTVVWHDSFTRDEDGDDNFDIYRSRVDGSEKVCLTCNLDGRHQVPVAQPKGDWILFHSWNGHSIGIGAPGFGGIGSDVWVMREDGSQQTNLTRSGDFEDHFHAYWSPDGKWIVWTALNWNADAGGTGKSDVRVARFDPNGPEGPRLVDEHVVRPGNGHWYETQWWAPDGSGFLYTETTDVAVNPELFFCQLKNPAKGECRPVRLTNHLAWDEQAIFTPDMKRVIFMSSRDLPGAHNTWTAAASLMQLPADYDYALILTVFFNNFIQPRFEQATDLWELTLDWNQARTRFKPGALRRLTETGNDGWVIPEFAWDPAGKRLLWSQARFSAATRIDQGCVIRRMRDAFIGRLANVKTIADLPSDLDVQVRDAAAEMLRDPRAYTPPDAACGGGDPDATNVFEQQTFIGRYVD